MNKGKAGLYANWLLRFSMTGMLLSAFGSKASHQQKPSIGIVFLAIGMFLVLYCQYYHAKHAGNLITTGPYRITRHPMYTSVFITNLALLWIPIPPITDKIFYIGQAILAKCMAGCWYFEEQAILAKYGLLAEEYFAQTPRLFFLYPIHIKRKAQKITG